MLDVAVGFSTPKSLFGRVLSWLIRKLDRTRASHTWLLYWDSTLECLMVAEAHYPAYRIVPFSTFKKKNRVVEVLEPKESLRSGLPMIKLIVGDTYDIKGLLGMSVVVFGKWLKKQWKNPWRSKKLQFCSEAVCRVLRHARYPGADDLDPDSCDLKQIWELLEKNSESRIKHLNAPEKNEYGLC